jgi:general secretion pathway protein G
LSILNINLRNQKNSARGFTLIELLIVMTIIGILAAISIFALTGARESARDARRKGDLEAIRSGLELFRSDCNEYPNSLSAGAQLVSAGTPTDSCPIVGNVYIEEVPDDPLPGVDYPYSSSATSYTLCAALEIAPEPAMDTTACGSCGTSVCNYIVVSP